MLADALECSCSQFLFIQAFTLFACIVISADDPLNTLLCDLYDVCILFQQNKLSVAAIFLVCSGKDIRREFFLLH